MTMIEQMARGLHAFIAPEVPWEALSPANQAVACDVARAGFETLRRPTDEVTAALDRVPGGWGRGAWMEGVDAALKP